MLFRSGRRAVRGGYLPGDDIGHAAMLQRERHREEHHEEQEAPPLAGSLHVVAGAVAPEYHQEARDGQRRGHEHRVGLQAEQVLDHVVGGDEGKRPDEYRQTAPVGYRDQIGRASCRERV